MGMRNGLFLRRIKPNGQVLLKVRENIGSGDNRVLDVPVGSPPLTRGSRRPVTVRRRPIALLLLIFFRALMLFFLVFRLCRFTFGFRNNLDIRVCRKYLRIWITIKISKTLVFTWIRRRDRPFPFFRRLLSDRLKIFNESNKF